MMKFYRIILAAGLLLALTCCRHHTEAPPDLGYDYYPGKVGSYIVYDVDSIVYRAIQNDTIHYRFQIKEKIDTMFQDNEGRPAFKLIRYKKNYNPNVPYSQMNWTLIKNVWMGNKTTRDLEIVENNIRYIKLSFPVKLNATWNGTAAADTNGAHNYKYEYVDQPASLGTNSFSKTLKVNQLYLSTAISYQDYEERFARGVGMIYKEITDYVLQDNHGGNIGKIYEGVHYVMTVNNYGVE